MFYTPDPNFSWLDSFTFKVNDGKADSVPATVLITVTPVNDPPTANDDILTAQEDIPVNIDVLANDVEVDNELLRVSAVTQGIHGSVTINKDGTLTYSPNANFYGTDAFTYTISDRNGETDTAKVSITVGKVNDPPVIVSKPVTTAMVGVLYTYDVNATDPDAEDTLTYSLITQPAGMTINSSTGLIQWMPTDIQEMANDIEVKVIDSNSTPTSDTQSFSIKVNPTPPKMATLTIADGYNHRSRKTLSADGKADVVRASNNNRLEIEFGSYISYDFSDVSIPAGASVTSVFIYVEHFEEEQFSSGKLQWEIGTGWPNNPKVWVSIDAPIYRGQQNEAIDSWDITSFVNTPEKVSSLELRIKNNDNIAKKKTSVDYIYAVVKWDWSAPQKPVKHENELELIR